MANIRGGWIEMGGELLQQNSQIAIRGEKGGEADKV